MLRRVLVLAFLLIAIGSSAAGCKKNSIGSYVPEQAKARQALQVALDAWKSNRKPDEKFTIEGGPDVLALDTDWRDGKKLQSYEIVSELPGVPNEPKQFKVKLTYEGQSPVETTYHVVGINPLRVFRADDYQNATGM